MVVLLASHPELRLLIPFIDAVGIDLFAILLGAQVWSYLEPSLLKLHRTVLLPVVHKFYFFFIFFLGICGPYLDAKIHERFPCLKFSP